MIVNGSREGTDTDAAASQVDHFTQQVFEAKGEKTFYCAAPGSPMKQHNQSSRVLLASSILCAEIRAQFNSQGPTEAAQSSGHMGPAAPRQGGQTHGPCTGRQTLSHWTPREAPLGAFHKGSEERPVMVPQG